MEFYHASGLLYCLDAEGAWVYRDGCWKKQAQAVSLAGSALRITEEEAAAIAAEQDRAFCAELESARKLARQAHEGQMDKAGKDYFTAHIETVAALTGKLGGGRTAQIAAYLHDILEDTDVTEAYLREQFSPAVADTVVRLTHQAGLDYMAYVRRIADDPIAVQVKLADLTNNMDLSRIPNPTEQDRQRVLKYAAAFSYLAAHRQDNGREPFPQGKENNMKLEIKLADITTLDTDAVVNAANESLAEGGGVCGAIFKAAGRGELTVACKLLGHCETGEAVITPGFRLKAKYIIHAVGPVWKGGHQKEQEKLYRAYRNSLQLAKETGCRSIGFPLISSGIFGYPMEAAWETALRACRDFAAENPDAPIAVVFAVRDEAIRDLGEAVLARFAT